MLSKLGYSLLCTASKFLMKQVIIAKSVSTNKLPDNGRHQDGRMEVDGAVLEAQNDGDQDDDGPHGRLCAHASKQMRSQRGQLDNTQIFKS